MDIWVKCTPTNIFYKTACVNYCTKQQNKFPEIIYLY